MNGLTVAEIAELLNITPQVAKKRLYRAGLKPIAYAGPTAVYDETVVDGIRNVPGRGRPPKTKPHE